MEQPGNNRGNGYFFQLHANQFTLCHLFQYSDGHTTGAHWFSGSIKKAFQWLPEITLDFVPNETCLPDTNSLGTGYWQSM
jgi:hypothetical protein